MRWAALLLFVAMLGMVGSGSAAGEPRETILAFMERRDRLPEADVPARIALARWAERRDLSQQAMKLYREVLALAPDHEGAYDGLFQLYAQHRLPEDEAWQEKVGSAFPDFKRHVTDHFLIVYDTDEKWARNRAALLEKAHDVYYDTFGRLGFRPMPLERRLVCVLYAEHADFAAYAKREDGWEADWSAGYYSSRTNRIVFFDDRTSPRFERLKQRIAELENEVDQQQARLQQAIADRNQALVLSLREEIRELHRQRRWYENRREAIAKMGDAMKTVHEAVHQLAFNSGLQSRRGRYPFWLSEGLATNFETDQPAKSFGPMHGNDHREAGVRRMVHEDALIPLDELAAAINPDVDDRDQMVRYYDQSWALFNYLFRFHREALREYMAELTGDPGERTEAELLEAFEEAFGDLERLESRFLRFCRKL